MNARFKRGNDDAMQNVQLTQRSYFVFSRLSLRLLFCLCVQLESDLLLSDVVISYGAQVTNTKTTVG